MSTDVSKYKRYSTNILDNTNTKTHKKLGRKSQGLNCKVTINFTQEEMDVFKQINEDTGAAISTIIRRNLIKSGLLKK
jgi:hypothetical protein